MTNQQTLILIGAGAAGLWYLSGKGAEAVKAVGNAIDPTNRDNIFSRGVDAVGDVLNDGASNDNFKLGTWLFGIFRPEDAARNNR